MENEISYIQCMNDLAELQDTIHGFAISDAVGRVEYMGSLGKDSVDRRSLGYLDQGSWRIISNSKDENSLIASEDVLVVIAICEKGVEDVTYECSSGGRIYLNVMADELYKDKIFEFFKSSK